MKHKRIQLFEVVVWRDHITWDEPIPRAQGSGELIQIIHNAMQKPFTRIEISDVTHWNDPSACNVSLTEDLGPNR